MKICITDKSVSSLIRLGIPARIVYGVIIDSPELYNAGWLCILMGGIIALPAAFACSVCRKAAVKDLSSGIRRRVQQMLCLVWIAIFALDSAFMASSISGSASYMVLDSSGAVMLMLPLYLLCAFCLSRGGDAIGFSAGLWNRIAGVLLLLIVVFQFPKYRFQWLQPIQGPGIQVLTEGALRAAGWLSLPSVFLILAEPADAPKACWKPLKNEIYCTIVSALIAMSFSLLTPSILDADLFQRSFRLDALLTNGRTPLVLQMPAVSVWFVGLSYALLMDAFCTAALMQKVFPNLDDKACILYSLLTMALVTMGGFADQRAGRRAAEVLFCVQGLAVALRMIICGFPDKRRAKCENGLS